MDSELVVAKTAEIVVAMLAQKSVNPAELPDLVRQVRAALAGSPPLVIAAAQSGLAGPRTSEPIDVAVMTPAVPIDQSVQHNHIISLEDGKPYRSLRRHLMAKYGMTPDDYRRKWSLPQEYPMVAPSYAQERSEVAKRSGLGKREQEPVPAKSRRALAGSRQVATRKTRPS